MEKEKGQYIDEIQKIVSESDLSETERGWFTENAETLSEVVDLYARKGKDFGIDEALVENPMLIVRSMMKFAPKLLEYQSQYDAALMAIAQANGISIEEEMMDIPKRIQEVSCARVRGSIVTHMEKPDAKIAIALNGIGGTGKDTVAKKAGLERVVNTTTRARRPSETQGVDYHFLREIHNVEIDNNTGIGTDGVDYFQQAGPYVVTVHRKDRAMHGTSVTEFQRAFAQSDVAFFIHGTNEVAIAHKQLPALMPEAMVASVSVLPPARGVAVLAARLVARTYNDPTHGVVEADGVYKVNDGNGVAEDYIESTIGSAQIKELEDTAKLQTSGVDCAYIVNDDLDQAVNAFRELVKKP